MAETLNSTRRFVFRDSKILVNVDHASDDLLVVSYPFKSKLFQGILIDSTNRYLPCAFPSPEVVKWSPPRVIDVKDPPATGGEPTPDTDRAFYSLSNRFTYFQDVLFQKNVALVKSAKQAKAKAQKMTVRLRPRQVLCSKCRSICNENSENVHSTSINKKDTKSDSSSNKNLLTESGGNENQNVEIKSPQRKVRTTLVPKLSRLEPDDIRTLNGAQGETGRSWSDMLEADRQMVLRKKRSVGSMEDLWDETVFEEASKKAKTTPIIKISFGSPGEGTVLKIPSKVRLSGSEGEEEEEKGVTETSKSFKKAMKKAKKEAKRKISPEREEEPSPEEPNYKKHRHRVKHKKRHKNSKEEEMKDKCLKQKLSISLRRVCGPGEEESWSGESSRSSEPVKDIDDTKPDLTQDLAQDPSRVGCDVIKESFKRISSEPSEHHKKNKKIGIQKRKKLIALEAFLEEKTSEMSKRLGDTILKEDSSVNSPKVVASSRLYQEPTPSVEFAQTSVYSKKGPAKVNADEALESKTCSIDNQNIVNSGSNISGKLEYFSATKDVSKRTTLIHHTVQDEPRVSSTQRKLKKNEDLFEKIALSPPELTSNKISSNPKESQKSVEIIYKIDDALDDTLVSEDSMPELDETIEDALLESDKEMPEMLENQRDISTGISSAFGNSSEGWETEREIPVLTRMVEPEEIKPCATISKLEPTLDRLKCSSLKTNISTRQKVVKNEDSYLQHTLEDVQLKLEGDVADVKCVQSTKLTLIKHLSPKTEDCLSLNQAQNLENLLPSDDPVDSSGESEFLPAEDNLECVLPGEIPPDGRPVNTFDITNVPSTLSSDALCNFKPDDVTAYDTDEGNISEKCVHSPDPKIFKDCLSPKTSSDFEVGQYSSDSTVPHVQPSSDGSVGEKRPKGPQHLSKRSVSCSLNNDKCSLTVGDKMGCETLEKAVRPVEHLSIGAQESPSLSNPTFGSKSSFKEDTSLQLPVLDSSSTTKSQSSSSLVAKVPKLDSLLVLPLNYPKDKSIPRPLSLQGDSVDTSKECDSKSPNISQDLLEVANNFQKESCCSEAKVDVSSSEISVSVDISHPKRSHSLSEDSMDIVPHFSESSAVSRDISSTTAATCHEDEGSEPDSTDTLLADGSLDAVPNFPESSTQGAPQEVTSCQTGEGFLLSVGDIVWAKIHGFPWWPAKVVRLCASGSGSSGCDARVAWFGSATSSLMSTDQLSPFIQTFKAKYNRERKSTGYLEAIRQATTEASSRDFHPPTPLAEIDKLLAL